MIQNSRYDRILSNSALKDIKGGFGERTLFEYHDISINSFYFMPVKLYIEDD